MKKTLLKSMLLAGMMAISMNAQAQFDEGKYYLMNVGASISACPTTSWGVGNGWGTQASLVKHPEYVILHPQTDGTYTMETQVSNGGTAYFFNGDYMDQSQPMSLTIKKGEIIGYSDDDDTVPVYGYTVQDSEGKYFGWDGTSTILGKDINISTEEGLLNATWVIVSEVEALNGLNEAEVDDVMDATFLILDPNFGRNNRNSDKWEGGELKKGGDNTNMNSEKYMTSFDIYQTLSGVPNGVYKIEAQAAVTFHDNRVIKEYDGNGYPLIYANEETTNFNDMVEADRLSSQSKMSASFTNGMYQVDPIYIKVTNGTIKLGAKSDRDDIWAVWDNFELTYFGNDCTIDQAKNAALFEEVNTLRSKAIELLSDVEVEAVISLLEDAIEDSEDVETAAEAEAAIASLTNAIDKAEASIIAKDVLEKMADLLESTNFYTEEAFDEYYGQYYEAYEEGTLTKAQASALQNPDVITNWHDANTVDDLLMSVWDAEPMDWNNYHVNTWSVEGDKDGTEFHVPFIEYWVGDGDALPAKTLTATIEDLDEGVYDVTGWIRVRIKNDGGSNASGITLQVNDGTAVDVTSDTQVPNTSAYGGADQMRLEEFSARGEVGINGELKVKFIVAADNNISWLSFKNMWYELNEVATGISEVSTSQPTATAIFNLAGQQVKKAQHGIFVKNGKKLFMK